MKKEHCVLILICCFLMAACGRLEDIPEDLSAFPETERKETAETPAGPQFETLTVAGGESWELQGASEEAYGAIWSNWPVTLRQGENVFCITGGGSFCRMRLELLDAVGVSYAGAFPEGTELQPLEGM